MIYFLQPTEGGPVKIGFTDNLDVRHRQLEAHYGKPLAVLATIPGDRETEAELHARFDHLRFGRTEQFRPAGDLMTFIGRPLLVGANPEAVISMDVVGLVAAIVLKDSPAYRDWLTDLSDRTLIPVTTIVRDALAKWAADRGLPPPPGSPTRRQRKVGDRKPDSGPPKRKAKG